MLMRQFEKPGAVQASESDAAQAPELVRTEAADEVPEQATPGNDRESSKTPAVEEENPGPGPTSPSQWTMLRLRNTTGNLRQELQQQSDPPCPSSGSKSGSPDRYSRSGSGGRPHKPGLMRRLSRKSWRILRSFWWSLFHSSSKEKKLQLVVDAFWGALAYGAAHPGSPCRAKVPSAEPDRITSRPWEQDGFIVAEALLEGTAASNYAIVQDRAEMGVIYERIIIEAWDLQSPNVILDIIGGAAKMKLDELEFNKQRFYQGLVEAALLTGAWVVTGGTGDGVMEMVGNAMCECDRQRRVPCIGVIPFGGLTRQWRTLFQDMRCNDPEAVQKAMESREEDASGGKPIPLAKPQRNHTHLLLVDSGVEGQAAFGTETEFRQQFESYASRLALVPQSRNDGPPSPRGSKRASVADYPRKFSSLDRMDDPTGSRKISAETPEEVPRVMILVNGGPFSLRNVNAAICGNCPLVICRGTGRIADAILAFHDTRIGECRSLEAAYEKMQAVLGAEKLNNEQRQQVKEIAESERVFEHTNQTKLENVILKALLSVQGSIGHKIIQLQLALKWRCIGSYCADLCGQLIKQMDGRVKHAIGIIFTRLVRPSGQPCQSLGAADKLEHLDASPIVKWLLDNYREEMDNFDISEHMDRQEVQWSKIGVPSNPTQALEGLLLWCIECKAAMPVLETLWSHIKHHPVHAALLAAAACRQTSDRQHGNGTYTDEVWKRKLEERALRFEHLAVRVLTALAESTGLDPVDYLFEAPCGKYQEELFRLARQLECKEFISTQFYRLAVDKYWMTPCQGQHSVRQYQKLNDKYQNPSLLIVALLNQQDATLMKLRCRELTSVPCFKAYTHAVSRFVFVGWYSHAVFEGYLTARGHGFLSKVALLSWAFGLLELEWRQLMQSYNGVLRDYISSAWNMLDTIHITVLLATLILGWFVSDDAMEQTRTERLLECIHAYNLLLTYIRCLQIFQLSEYFGTMLLIVQKMLKDACYFFLLLGFFCMAFSCSLTPLLFSDYDKRREQGVLWALWAIFGEKDEKAWERVTGLQWWQTQYSAAALLYLLSLMSNVLLVNLLITVFGDTYNTQKERSETEWAFLRVNAVLEYDEAADLPPPLNLLEWFMPRQDAPADNLHRRRQQFNQRDLKEAKRRALEAVCAEVKQEEQPLVESLRSQVEQLETRVQSLEGKES